MSERRPLRASLVRNAVWPVVMLLALTPALVLSNGGYDLSWWTIDGGGHTFSASADGVFSLGGTIGQPDAGVMAGGNHTLTGGFWAADTVVAPPPVGDGVILVQDQAGTPVAGAQVFRNHGLAGVTAADGRLTLPDLAAGDRLVARLRIREQPSPKPNHAQDATQNWAYRVYITSMDILGTGAAQPWVVNDPQQTQTLTLKTDNTLIGFNIVASIEWDANAAYLEDFRQGMALASQYLYNASNGQMLFERVTLYDNNQHMASADFQIRASNQEWPRAHVGGLLGINLYVFLGRFFDGSSANTGSWTAPSGYRTHIHEFGHYGLYLYDSYLDANREPNGHCTSPAIRTNDTPGINATLMDYQYNATQFAVRGVSGLWSGSCEQTYQVFRNNGQSDWETIVARYRDPSSPPRWTLKTPVHYGAVVPGPTALAVNAWSTVTIGNDANTGVCDPPPTYQVPGSQTRAADVTLRTSTRTIVQGITDDQGRITVLGAANGDRVIFNARNADLLIGSIDVTCPPPAVVAANGATPVVLQPAPFTIWASVVPGAVEHQAELRVSASAALPAAPVAHLTQHGSDTAVPVPLVYEAASQSYVGLMTLLPDGPRSGSLVIRARDAQEREVEIATLFSLDTALRGEDAIIVSADGQAELYIPAHTLSADGTVALEASHLLSELPGELVLLSGPYAAQAAAGLTLTGDATLTLRYLDFGSPGRFSPTAAQIHRWDGAQWIALETTVSAAQQIASARVAQFGIYALLASQADAVYLPLVVKGR